VGERSLHTREVAGSKPAAPIPPNSLLMKQFRRMAVALDHVRQAPRRIAGAYWVPLRFVILDAHKRPKLPLGVVVAPHAMPIDAERETGICVPELIHDRARIGASNRRVARRSTRRERQRPCRARRPALGHQSDRTSSRRRWICGSRKDRVEDLRSRRSCPGQSGEILRGSSPDSALPCSVRASTAYGADPAVWSGSAQIFRRQPGHGGRPAAASGPRCSRPANFGVSRHLPRRRRLTRAG
jgi:hypothetical protein